jgi:hypothetical protein
MAEVKGGPYLDRMNNIPKLAASRTLTEPLERNATLIKSDVPIPPSSCPPLKVFAED